MTTKHTISGLFLALLLPSQGCDLTADGEVSDDDLLIGQTSTEATVSTPQFVQLRAILNSTNCAGVALYAIERDHRRGGKVRYRYGVEADPCQSYDHWVFPVGNGYWDGNGYYYGQIRTGTAGMCLTNLRDGQARLEVCDDDNIAQRWYASRPNANHPNYVNFTNYNGTPVCLNYDANARWRVRLGTCNTNAAQWYFDRL